MPLSLSLNSLNSLILVHFSSFFGNLGSIGTLDTGNPSSNFHRPRHRIHLAGGAKGSGSLQRRGSGANKRCQAVEGEAPLALGIDRIALIPGR